MEENSGKGAFIFPDSLILTSSAKTIFSLINSNINSIHLGHFSSVHPESSSVLCRSVGESAQRTYVRQQGRHACCGHEIRGELQPLESRSRHLDNISHFQPSLFIFTLTGLNIVT